jgi:hypothetical protein
MSPKNEKRPLTLSSPGTPEQPSPRTAQAQDSALARVCKFHLRASLWHNPATPWLGGRKASSAVEHFLVELVYCESLTQRLYTSMQLFALRSFSPVREVQRKLRLFNHIRFGRLWKLTCTL